MILHELFFGSLGDESAPEGQLRHRLTLHFGALTAGAVLRNGQSQRLGLGGLAWSQRDPKLIDQWRRTTRRRWPVTNRSCAIDMYKYSYQIDYGARAAAYVDVFMAAIKRPNVARLYQAPS